MDLWLLDSGLDQEELYVWVRKRLLLHIFISMNITWKVAALTHVCVYTPTLENSSNNELVFRQLRFTTRLNATNSQLSLLPSAPGCATAIKFVSSYWSSNTLPL